MNIIIVDDDAFVSASLKIILESYSDITVLATGAMSRRHLPVRYLHPRCSVNGYPYGGHGWSDRIERDHHRTP